jgi:anti-anti-sigma factor
MSDLECLVGSAVVVLPDEIDVLNAGSVGEQLVAAIVPGVAVVVADLSMTTFCDCAAVRSLLLVHREASAGNAELRLVARSRAVLRILELLGTDQVLPVYPDLSAALAGGGREARQHRCARRQGEESLADFSPTGRTVRD